MADVLDLREYRDRRPRAFRPNDEEKPGNCGHKHVGVDLDLERVYCRDCGEALDPFRVLIQIAREREKQLKAEEE